MSITMPGVVRLSHDQPLVLGSCKVKASTAIPLGALISVIAGTGFAINGASARTHLVQGWAKAAVDNSGGADGDKTVEYYYGVGFFTNSGGGDALAQADYGKPCFLVDNDVVAKTSNGGARSIAGVFLGLDPENGKARVMVGPHISAALAAVLALGGALSNFQIATGTITAGVCTINTGIVVTADTYAIPVPLAAITGSTNVGPLAFMNASKVAGAAGVGTIVFNVLGNNGTTDTDAAGTLVALIFN